MLNQQIKTKEAERILRQNGYSCIRKRGSHKQYHGSGGLITINTNLNPCVWAKIIKQNKIDVNV